MQVVIPYRPAVAAKQGLDQVILDRISDPVGSGSLSGKRSDPVPNPYF